MTDDMISRQAAIDICTNAIDLWNGQLGEGALVAVQGRIKALPSAQPVAKDINVPVKDCISRRAALDALGEEPLVWHEDDAGEIAERAQWRRDVAAIKAVLPAQPDVPDTNVGDMISRQAAVRWVKTECNPYGKHTLDFESGKKVIEHLEQMPSAQPGWIPWDSGKFPKESGTYTVTAYDGATRRVTYAKYQKRLKRWELTGARAYWRVIAWMPSPKPWEGDKNE